MEINDYYMNLQLTYLAEIGAIEPETIEGDYAEAWQRDSNQWAQLIKERLKDDSDGN